MTAPPRSAADLLVGVDLGTSALKCGIWDPDGGRLGSTRVPYPPENTTPDGEQSADTWWRMLTEGVRAATGGIDGARIAGLALGGNAPSPVFVDAALRPVAPVTTWRDARAEPQARRIAEALGGQPPRGPVRLAQQVAARALWLREADPEAFARATTALHSWDFLIARLTGERAATTPACPQVLDATDLPASLLPARVCRPGEIVGSLTADAAARLGLPARVPVVTGGLDSFLGSVGSGMCAPGDACINGGSSSVVALLARPPTAGRFELAGLSLQSVPAGPGGAAVRRALSRLCAKGEGDALLGEALWRRPCTVLAPSDDADFDVRVDELADRGGAAAAVRAVLDGMVLAERRMLRRLEGPVCRVRMVGGQAARSPLAQLRADALGEPVEVPADHDSGALGAAMLAAAALGLVRDPGEAASRMVRVARVHHPASADSTALAELAAVGESA